MLQIVKSRVQDFAPLMQSCEYSNTLNESFMYMYTIYKSLLSLLERNCPSEFDTFLIIGFYTQDLHIFRLLLLLEFLHVKGLMEIDHLFVVLLSNSCDPVSGHIKDGPSVMIQRMNGLLKML